MSSPRSVFTLPLTPIPVVRECSSTPSVVQVTAHVDHDADVEARSERSRSVLDGVCRLTRRLHDAVGIARVDGDDGEAAWTMLDKPLTRNGFGGLHGGIAFDLVTDAAVDAAGAVVGGVAEPHGALLRSLAPAVAGPFRAVPTVMPQSDGAVFVRVAIVG